MMHFCKVNLPGNYECDAHCEMMNTWKFIGYHYVWFDELSYLWEGIE